MRKWEDDNARAEAVRARHSTFQVFFVGLFMFLTICSMVTGCTYYNVEKVKQPVKYEHNHSETYERSPSGQ